MVVVVEVGLGGRKRHKQVDTNKKKVIFDENFAARMFPVKGGACVCRLAFRQTHAKDSFPFSPRKEAKRGRLRVLQDKWLEAFPPAGGRDSLLSAAEPCVVRRRGRPRALFPG